MCLVKGLNLKYFNDEDSLGGEVSNKGGTHKINCNVVESVDSSGSVRHRPHGALGLGTHCLYASHP
jgi:hypothetical protein